MAADPGNVIAIADRIFAGTAQSTALEDFDAPTPVILPAIMCVELIGIPRRLAERMTREAEVSAAKPCRGSILVMEKAIVRMMRSPPEAVPSPIARAQAKITHKGISGAFNRFALNSPNVIMPMLF